MAAPSEAGASTGKAQGTGTPVPAVSEPVIIHRRRAWNSPRSRQQAVLLCLALPALIYVALFFAYPLYQDITISFENYGFAALAVGHGPFVGFANYTAMLTSGVTIRAIVNTVVFTVGSIVFQFTIGFAMALYLHRSFAMSGLLRRVMLIPWVLPLVTTGAIFTLIFATSNGLANELLRGAGLIHGDVGWFTSGYLAVAAITVANIWAGVPFNAVLLYSGLQDVPNELLEAASVDGANAWRRFTRVTVPMMRQVILIVLMLGIIYTVKAFDLVIVLTGGGPANQSQLLSSWSYTQAFSAFQFGTGTAVGNILMVFTFLVGMIYLLISRGNVTVGGGR